jgi:hypothetical protein
LAKRQTLIYYLHTSRSRIGYGTSCPTTTEATTDLFWRHAPIAWLARDILIKKVRNSAERFPSKYQRKVVNVDNLPRPTMMGALRRILSLSSSSFFLLLHQG